jgi:hypothetical protein
MNSVLTLKRKTNFEGRITEVHIVVINAVDGLGNVKVGVVQSFGPGSISL